MTGTDLRNKMKNWQFQTCWKPSILLHSYSGQTMFNRLWCW